MCLKVFNAHSTIIKSHTKNRRIVVLILLISFLQSRGWSCDRRSRKTRWTLRCAWPHRDPHFDLAWQSHPRSGVGRISGACQDQHCCQPSSSTRSVFFVESASSFLPADWPSLLWASPVAWSGYYAFLLQPDQPTLIPGSGEAKPRSSASGNRRVVGAGAWSCLRSQCLQVWSYPAAYLNSHTFTLPIVYSNVWMHLFKCTIMLPYHTFYAPFLPEYIW